MKTNTGGTENQKLLQKFAVKNKKVTISYNDTAVIYNRCSSKQQDSLEWQAEYGTKFCANNKLVLVKSFSEKLSAKTDERIEFKKMLLFCEKEKIGHIIFFSYDRFSRSGDLTLIKTLKKKGIKVHAATQQVDDETSSGRLSQALFLMFAQFDNEERGKKVVEGLKKKLRRGEWPGIPTPGYEKRFLPGKTELDPEKKQCYINDDGRKLKQAFHWKDKENISNVQVIERLEAMGLTLTMPKLTRIFRNPFYAGYITHKLLDDGEIIRGKHEPLVSEEVFLRVNGFVNERSHGWNIIRENEDMPLKASIRCGICERPLTAYTQKAKFIYYKCPKNGCHVNVSNKKLHSLFETQLSKLQFDQKLEHAIKRQLENTYETIHSHDTVREKPMKDELTRLKNELETMELNFVISKVTPEIFAKYSASHKQKIQTIEEELKSLVNDSSNLSIFIDAAVQNANNLFKMWQNLDYKGKVRLQKLVYPEGLVYFPETHSVRTLQINPIFTAISSISKILTAKSTSEVAEENEKFHSVYLMFSSSNFFWDNLLKIQNQMEEIKCDYPEVWKSLVYKQQNPLTGATEVTAFNYTSNLTNAVVIPDSINENLSLLNTNYYSGATIHLGV